MRRRLVTILAALSLFVCLGLAGVWCYTATGPHTIQIARIENVASVCLHEGGLEGSYKARLPSGFTLASADKQPFTYWAMGGVVVQRLAMYPPTDADIAVAPTLFGTVYTLIVPYWLLLLISLAVPVVWLRGWLHRRKASWRESHMLCTKCGYDLRESTERCPECGTPAAART